MECDAESLPLISFRYAGVVAMVALIGTGRMGTELGRHLLAAGHHLTIWNRTPDTAAPLVAAGATQAPTAADAVKDQDLVVTCLFGPDTVQQVVLDQQLLPPQTLWLDITTVGPDDADRFAKWANDNHMRYVHGPVVGSLGPAKARKLGVYLGGAAPDVAAVIPFVELWADPERLVELPTQRAAAIGKLVANLALSTALEGLVEALGFAEAMDVDAASALKMLKSTALGFIADMKGPIILNQTYQDTQFSVDLLAKDANLMLTSMPDGAPQQLPAVTGLLATLTKAQQAGRGDWDIAAAAI